MTDETPEEQVQRILAERDGSVIPSVNPSPEERRLANLKPAWQPGESGNPQGKPAGTVSLRTILKNKLAETPDPNDRRTLAEQLVDSTCKAALRGDSQARKLIWESIEGAARQRIEVDTPYDPIFDLLEEVRMDGLDYSKLSDQTLRELSAAYGNARAEQEGAE